MNNTDFNTFDDRWNQTEHFKTKFKSLHDFLSQASKKKSRKTLEKWLENKNIYYRGDSGIENIIVLGWIFGVPSGIDIDELSTIEELISYEGGDWIDEHRELAVGYIANDALEEVKNLGLSFMNEVDLTFVPQTKGELTLFDAIKYISNEDPASMLHFEANDFDIAHDY